MSISPDTLVVLWSPHQDTFHVESVADMLETNHRIYFESRSGDFIVMAFAPTFSDASKIAESLKSERDQS